MNIVLIVIAVLLAVACFVLVMRLQTLRREKRQLLLDREAAQTARQAAEQRCQNSEMEVRTWVERGTLAQARLEEAERRLSEEKAEREKMEERLREQFKNLANDILGEQSRSFKETQPGGARRAAQDLFGTTSPNSASGSRRSTPRRMNSGVRCATSWNG